MEAYVAPRESQTLPDGWTVEQTLDGRYLFMSPRHSGIPNSWKHPDVEYDPKAYERPEHSIGDSFTRHVPPYETLSYSWGTADNEEYIHITDLASTHNTPAWLKIRKNLAAALRHLRYPDRPRTLWIDAICINQADIEERGRQKVIIWLGSESEDSKHALETLEYFSKQVEYFERVWVLQEALSCDRVVLQCGRDTISWVHVRKALLVLRQKSSILPHDFRDRLFPYARGLIAPPLASCEHLFLWTRNQQCSDPRDKVYGILGLLDPRIVAKIEVDYSTPAWKTYAQLVLAEMEVPNLDRPIECANMGYLSIRRFYASARSSAVAKLIEPAYHLQVTGRRISTISRVSHDLTGTFAQLIEVVRNWAPNHLESNMYVSGGLSIDAYVEELVRGRTSNRALGDNPCLSIRRLRELLMPALATAELDDKVARAFKDCFFVNECLFTTTEGYIGVSARGLRKGESPSCSLLLATCYHAVLTSTTR
ncbi:hypothetical protein K505DRAFT_354874 [Melanomma pulvis-pyrius CBS 109.77]|uniref:Heterokaryon incompatibility domain-containing protein n=1 Tax=Melanomma pulvis-pyrius CBS 109.77 TaxID=1314802 RepID=A0A6A6WP19_9PLEO|nr:hypothetical protein K505DRAFT_354874 [Melanomma pulvis-pyrius CBS 109.77]